MKMMRRTLPALLLGFAAAPVPAQQAGWTATASPISQQNGPAYCLMSRRDAETEASFYASATRSIVGVYSPALEGLGTTLDMTLRIGSIASDTLTWAGENGTYLVALDQAYLTSLLDNVLIADVFTDGQGALSLRVDGEELVQVPLDGASSVSETMTDCRAQLPPG